MLAKQMTFAITALLVGSLTLPVSVAIAQNNSNSSQPPSQRYQPVRNMPPSVHVPDTAARSIRGSDQANQNANQPYRQSQRALSQAASIDSGSTSFNFADTPKSSFDQTTGGNVGVRQVAYEQIVAPPANEPQVPAVLRQNSPRLIGQESTAAHLQNQNLNSTVPFPAESLSHAQRLPTSDNPVVDARAFAPIKQMLQDQRDQRHVDSKSSSDTQLLTARQTPAADNANQREMVRQVIFTQAESQVDDTSNSDNGGVAARPLRGSKATLDSMQEMTKLRASHAAGSNDQSFENVQQVAAESEAIENASIQLGTPAILLKTFGPTTIGIHKTSTYKVTVSNDSNFDADQIRVAINMPQWVDLQDINVTGGQREVTDGTDQARLVWALDRIPANTTHTITVNAIPRKAELFDLGVEWKFAPRTGLAHVTVTEPKLEMKIAGPNDVLYGEKAIYHVTVRNPGTGPAEHVSVMLPEALGGERASLGNIPAGSEKNFQVELFARTGGSLDLSATAAADGNLQASVDRKILVRRANLDVTIQGPPMKYSGTVGHYAITVNNNGDAAASDVIAALALPPGVKYLSGLNGVKEIENGLRWPVGTLNAGDKRTFEINCQLDTAGDLQIEAGARGGGDLAASGACITRVETIADLVLSVVDPKGPLPTGETITYQIHVKNRGTRSANDVNLVMQFSDGIEPTRADGLKHKIVPGQILFSPITQIDPGQELVLNVEAQAQKNGTHIFRAQLTCTDSDSREIAEGTTRFFGEEIQQNTEIQTIDVPNDINTADVENQFDTDTNDFNR